MYSVVFSICVGCFALWNYELLVTTEANFMKYVSVKY